MAETVEVARKDQIARAQQIQELLLNEFERQLTPNKKGIPQANSMTIATITKWLERGGWTVLNPRVPVFPGSETVSGSPKPPSSSTPSLGTPEPI